jgi:hypothetical protein
MHYQQQPSPFELERAQAGLPPLYLLVPDQWPPYAPRPRDLEWDAANQSWAQNAQPASVFGDTRRPLYATAVPNKPVSTFVAVDEDVDADEASTA